MSSFLFQIIRPVIRSEVMPAIGIPLSQKIKGRFAFAMIFLTATVFNSASSYALDAGFELNLSSHSGSGNGQFQQGVHNTSGTAIEDIGGTSFLVEDAWFDPSGEAWQLPEIVTINVEGVDQHYYHFVMGDLADGFIQETYIQTGFTMTMPSTTPSSWISGMANNQFGSASAGSFNVVKTGSVITDAANGSDPLGVSSISGNGSGNPNRVIMLQINSDGEMYQEFRKEALKNKPVIYQNVARFGEIDMTFEIDMSNSTYDQNGLEVRSITNTMQLFGDNLPAPTSTGWNSDWGATPPDAANFDMATAGQNVNVNGGQYTYIAEPDTTSTPGGSGGQYIYSDGGFDVDAVSWESYFRADDPSGNPWAYTENRPLP